MKTSEVMHAWAGILTGRRPPLSIEITRECPLRCPGCYAFDDAHLGGGVTLRGLADYKNDALLQGLLRLVDYHKPLRLSLVSGDPLVRYRELEVLLPELDRRGIHVQIVISAFREIPKHCATHTISADLKTAITPCKFGGKPDCSQCGCIASMGMAAVGHHKVAGNLTAGRIFIRSDRVGYAVRKFLDQSKGAA